MRLLVVVSVLGRCSAVWRFGAGGLVVVLVVVLVNVASICKTPFTNGPDDGQLTHSLPAI